MGILFVGRTQLLDPRNTVSGENVNVMMDSYVNMGVVMVTSLIIRKYNDWPIGCAFLYFLTNIRLFVRK